MFRAVGMPLIVVGLLALILLVFALMYKKEQREKAQRARKTAYVNWDGVCKFDNPETGAVCQRTEFHLENHYHDVNGKLVTWP